MPRARALVGVSSFVASLVAVSAALAAPPRPSPTPSPTAADPRLGGLAWRNIGPHRGGRSVAVAGVPGQPLVYYFGATGGGVWKTTDAGITWKPVTDGHLGTGSVGALAVAESDPNVVYVGMGESSIRGNVSHGDGVYKTRSAACSARRTAAPPGRTSCSWTTRRARWTWSWIPPTRE
jgi:hypothetical protein